MAHRFTFTVTVELERESGKFASRDEMAETIADAIRDADPGDLYGLGVDGESTYNVTSWEAEEA